MEITELQRDLAATFRWTARLNMHEGVANHFSACVPDSSTDFYVNKAGIHFSQLKASDLILVTKENINDLKNINLKLWDIEDGKRAAEKNKNFDEKFIELARNVYKFNDERAKIKLAINTSLGSNIKEVKSYE